MAKPFLKSAKLSARFLLYLCFLFLVQPALAQRRPTIVEPKARTDNKTIKPVKAAPPSKGVLIVLFDPEVEGKITIETLAGKLVEEGTADASGQAQFVLKRGLAYRVKGAAQGYQSDERKSKILKATDTVLLKLTAKTATLNLVDMPVGAKVFIGEEPQARGVVDQTGSMTISDLTPGLHKLKIKHPEYRDFLGELSDLKAGARTIYPVTMDKVAVLTFESLPGARVLIDGALRGTVQNDGKVVIDYVIDQIGEHTIGVELLGYQPSSSKKTIAPGPSTIKVRLDPIVTSGGISDGFDDFFNWQTPPPSWELVRAGVGSNKRLRVKGAGLGLLKNQVYRDIQEDSGFIIWLDDGKGASWVVKADQEGLNYYLFHLAGPKSTTHEPNKFYTYVVQKGEAPEQVSLPFPVQVTLNETTSYEIHIEVSGERVRHWITNEMGEKIGLGSWTDTSPTKEKFLYGTFGFRSLNGEVFSVDDLVLATKKQD
jgi:hypothetical protein